MRYRLVGMFVLLCVATASAQSVSTAQINGTVRDESGAGLPGATITVTQTDTGLVRSTISDEAGSYILQNLPIGPYRLSHWGATSVPFQNTLGETSTVASPPSLGAEP